MARKKCKRFALRTDKGYVGYRALEIPKNKGVRHILIPTRKERQRLSEEVVPALAIVQQCVCDEDIVHGFMQGRNPVTNALQHIGFAYTLSIDLADFFDHVTPAKVTHCGIAPDIREFPKGTAAQGLATSPAWANIAAVPMDTELRKICDELELQHNTRIVYTRYADDLSFSSNSHEALMQLKGSAPTPRHPERQERISLVRLAAAKSGFDINPRKTKLQWAGKDGSWSRDITGVAVANTAGDFQQQLRGILQQYVAEGTLTAKQAAAILARMKPIPDTHVRPTRKARRKLLDLIRTQPESRKTQGMLEWTNCRIPHKQRIPAKDLQKAYANIKFYFDGYMGKQTRLPAKTPTKKG